MKAIQCALKSNDAATSDFGVISLSLLSTERQWYEGHIHPQLRQAPLPVTCDASHPTPHIFIVLLASPPVAVLVLLIPHLQLFFLTPLCPRLWRHYCSHDLDSSGDSGFVVRKMATFSFRTKFSARMLTYTIEEPGRSSVFSMWITEHILFPVKRVRVGRYENECVWMLHLQSHNDCECVSIASDLLAKGRV